jgi:predicted GNAT family N-acyltransferase
VVARNRERYTCRDRRPRMEIRRVESEEAIAEALAVRRAVFIDEQGVPENRELDGRDDESIHVLARDGDDPVGAARLRADDGDTAKAERVAVLASRRGEGIGRRLMATVEAVAAAEGYETILLHAQVPVVAFYERLGYEVTSEPFEDAGIPHREMRKSL